MKQITDAMIDLHFKDRGPAYWDDEPEEEEEEEIDEEEAYRDAQQYHADTFSGYDD